MRAIEEKYQKEIDDLVNNAPRRGDRVSLEDLSCWRSRLGSMVGNLYPENSQIYKEYDALGQAVYKILEIKNKNILETELLKIISQFVGLKQTIQHEIKNGLLTNAQNLLRADIFSNFLEQAEHLLNQGYKDAAAVITGGVLEDTLKKLCSQQNITTQKGEKNEKGEVLKKNLPLSEMNHALEKKGQYNALIKKKIESWGDLRNNAAHGKYDQYTKDQVKSMLAFVQDFVANT